MEQLRLSLSCNEYDRTRFLVDGTVQAEGIDLNVVSLPSEERHRAFPAISNSTFASSRWASFLVGWLEARRSPRSRSFRTVSFVTVMCCSTSAAGFNGRRILPVRLSACGPTSIQYHCGCAVCCRKNTT